MLNMLIRTHSNGTPDKSSVLFLKDLPRLPLGLMYCAWSHDTKNTQQSWRICFVQWVERFTVSSTSSASLFPSHQRTQWIVNKWKSRKRMTTMRTGSDDGSKSMRIEMTFMWKGGERIALLYFSHGSQISSAREILRSGLRLQTSTQPQLRRVHHNFFLVF